MNPDPEKYVTSWNNGKRFSCEPSSPSDELNHDKIDDIIKQLSLQYGGIVTKHTKYDDRITFVREEGLGRDDEFIELLKLIPLLFEPIHSRKGINSYGAKHILEKGMKHGYICNGQAILAFMYLGFEVSKYVDGDTPNMNIHAKLLIKDEKVVRDIMCFLNAVKNNR